MTPNIRTLIADDERLARQKLSMLLAGEPGVTLIGECRDGAEALAAVRQEKPDLLFLDVRMPLLDGFKVLENLSLEETPAIVFTTAFDQFAIRAFETNAVDYLLKPFDRNRLARALERVRLRLIETHDRAVARRVLADLIARARAAQPEPERLMIKASGRIVFLEFADIEWIEAAANYVRIHAAGESYLLRESISHLAARLDPNRFVRIHRSTIVNVSRVRELQPCESGEHLALLVSGKALSCSRGYRAEVQRLIQQGS